MLTYISLFNAENLSTWRWAKVVVEKSKTTLQADRRTFLMRLWNREINPSTVSESKANSSLASKETSEAAPMMSEARHASSGRVERSRVGSNARRGVIEVWERRRKRRSLNRHLLMKITEWGVLERDASNKAKMALASEERRRWSSRAEGFCFLFLLTVSFFFFSILLAHGHRLSLLFSFYFYSHYHVFYLFFFFFSEIFSRN